MPAHPSAAAPIAAADPTLHLRADGISFSFPDRRVLTDISLVVPAGRPTGLLGENGSGKSTLLRILAGELPADSGTHEVPGPVGVLHQELPFGPAATLTDVVADALERSRRLERELIAAGEELASEAEEPGARAAQRYDALLAEATLADIWNADRRAEEVLAGLGLDALEPSTALVRISGGLRERLDLSNLLIARPTSCLLLDTTTHIHRKSGLPRRGGPGRAGTGRARALHGPEPDQRRPARAPGPRAPAHRPAHQLAAGRAHQPPRRRRRRLPHLRRRRAPGPRADRQP